MNFKKLHRGDLKCVLKCNEDETQIHIFQKCQPVLARLGNQAIPAIENIYGSISDQKSAVYIFTQIDQIRKQLLTPNL